VRPIKQQPSSFKFSRKQMGKDFVAQGPKPTNKKRRRFSLLRLRLGYAYIVILGSFLFFYLIYFCYYLWVLLHFLVLFMGPIILFKITFRFIYRTFSKNILISAK